MEARIKPDIDRKGRRGTVAHGVVAASRSQVFDSSNQSPLLAPLTGEQQHVIDLLAEAFLAEDYQWPYFDYVEGVVDDAQRDAVEILLSFPTIGRWGYGAVAWNRNDSPNAEVALTVVGMSHSAQLRQYVPVFFRLVDFLCARRRLASPVRRGSRNLTVTSEEFNEYWVSGRRLGLSPRLTVQLKEHEPPTRWGGGTLDTDGEWTTSVARQLLPFENLETIGDYVTRLEALIGEPAAELPPVLQSPLSLAAALDYLNAVWRLTHASKRLFDFTSAERTTRLAFDVATGDEFAAHLSAFSDILREANKRLPDGAKRKDRDRPLARIEADLVNLLEPDAAVRVREAIRTLELVIALRDADQHRAASERALQAFRELRLPYPVIEWGAAWKTVSAQAINALSAVREELEALAD